jgi:hypothetical protein
MTNFMKTEHLPKLLNDFANHLSSDIIPKILEDAIENKNWVDAMNVEMKALEKNNTWELTNLPSEKNSLGVDESIMSNTMQQGGLKDIRHI